MAQKSSLSTDADELFAGIEGIDTTSSSSNRTSDRKTPPSNPEDDPLAGLEAELAVPHPSSRPNTPKVPSSSAASRTRSPKRAGAITPSSSASARTSEDKVRQPRKSGESTRAFHQGLSAPKEEERTEQKAEPSAQQQQQQSPAQGGGGWWGSIISTASAAVQQVDAAYKEIQRNEEAQKWIEQAKGNVGTLRGIGGELRSRAIPTFTSIINTLAPPISQHERLQIHITHDLVGYPSLDPIIYQTFSRVMAQVEGGDLMVIQRGSESGHKRPSDAGFTGSNTSGWSDGPWWRSSEVKRDLSTVKGLVEGTKLARVSAETYANEFFASKGGVEEAAKQATETLSETNPTRSSDIFLALQPISYNSSADDQLFGIPPSSPQKQEAGGVEEPKEEPDRLVCIAVYLHDPIHSISFRALSQSFPEQWTNWLDASADQKDGQSENSLPADISEIVLAGGVDPREWIAEWIEEAISLSVGIVAQRYVARRMGVGEGGLGRGKARQEAIDSGAGEAARAGAI